MACIPISYKKKFKLFKKKSSDVFRKKGIQTRTIFTGNILRQPLMKNKYYKKHNKSHIISDDVMRNGILIGCHHGLRKKDLNRMTNIFKKLLDKYKK